MIHLDGINVPQCTRASLCIPSNNLAVDMAAVEAQVRTYGRRVQVFDYYPVTMDIRGRNHPFLL